MTLPNRSKKLDFTKIPDEKIRSVYEITEDDAPRTYGKLIKFLGASLVEARLSQDWASVAKLAREQALLIRTNPRRGRPNGETKAPDPKQLSDEELLSMEQALEQEAGGE